MPRNANGVYTLPSGNPVVPGTLIETTWVNPTMADLANEITQSLPRNGSAAMTGPLILSRDGILPKEATTVNQLTAYVSGNNSFLPAGAIQAFAMNTVPTGWLECNGVAVSRVTYANLFSVIGVTYGAGNGVTTFNLPDLRGEFIRGLDNGRGADPGRTLGSNQTGANNPHTHTIVDPSHNHTQNAHVHGVTDPGHHHGVPMGQPQAPAYGAYVADNQYGAAISTNNNVTGISVNSTTGTNNATSTGISINQEGTEARPRNVAMVYCIKAFGALQTDGLGTMAFQNKESVAITGGTGVFTTLQCTTAPTNPNDVARLVDVGGSVAEVLSADPAMILVDNTTPSTPILRPQANVANGIVKLDANGKIPNALMDPTGYNYQGTWNASTGALPSGLQLDGSMYYIDVAGTLNLYHSNGVQSSTLCPIGTRIVYVTDSPTLPVPGWYYEPPPVLAGATASQIVFTPAGTIAAGDVQAAIAELDSETQTALAGKAPTSAQTAIGTSFTPAGNIAATDVQAAIAELDTEKAPVSFGVPTGAVMSFAISAAPSGWVECNGQTVSRTGTGAALFAAVGTFYGVGDGSTTFNVPDYRGYFLRALGTNADGTASGARGVKTADTLKSHNHGGTVVGVGDHAHNVFPNVASSAVAGGGYGAIDSGGGKTDFTTANGAHTHTINADGTLETAPKNMAVLTCIKL